jgi:PepSY-associated TM region
MRSPYHHLRELYGFAVAPSWSCSSTEASVRGRLPWFFFSTNPGSSPSVRVSLSHVNPSVLNRKIHYWAGFSVAVPMLVLIGSGLLLQMKKHWGWVQPPEHQGTGSVPVLDLEGILSRLKSIPEMSVTSWDDVNRLDVRPGKGVVKVWLHTGYEVQVDLGTGEVLQTAYRRSDLIESIHDGSFFAGNWTKLGLFLPTGMVLLLLWMSGLWMFWQPIAARRRRAALAATRASSPGLSS